MKDSSLHIAKDLWARRNGLKILNVSYNVKKVIQQLIKYCVKM